jgi:hypothetical protein
MSYSTGAFIRSSQDPVNVARLRRRAEERAPDPSIFETREPWFGRAVASTAVVDDYFTKPDPLTTLKNYAVDLTEGRALLIGHQTGAINLGMSLIGQYEAHGYTHVRDDGTEERVPWVYGDFYLMRGREPQDSTIEAFQGGTQDRFSVGFQPGWWRCSVDGLDLFSWDCPHIPGRSYDAKGKPVDNPADGVLAYADLVDMRLRELSTVYANAAPGATFLKAQRMVESGAVHEWKTVRLIEQIYRHKLPGTERVYPAAQPVEREAELTGTEKSGEGSENTTAEQVNGVELGLVIDRAELTALGLPVETTASELIGAFKTHRANAAKVEAYTTEAINDACKEGARALGAEHWNEDRQRKMLANLDMADITSQRREWAAMGDNIFATGRKTVEKADEEPAENTRQADKRENGRERAGSLGKYAS